jgi:hypothetical protein
MKKNNITNAFSVEQWRKEESRWYEKEVQFLKHCALIDIDKRVEVYTEEQAKRLLKMMSYDR